MTSLVDWKGSHIELVLQVDNNVPTRSKHESIGFRPEIPQGEACVCTRVLPSRVLVG